MKIAIVGCGNIGAIYAQSFLKFKLVSRDDLFLVEKDEKRMAVLSTQGFGRPILIDDPLLKMADVIFLAVKPQDFRTLSPLLKRKLRNDQLVISIMAGITIKQISESLDHVKIIRAMPNSPIELGLGMTGFTASEFVQGELIRKAENLLSSTGRTLFLENEDLMDSVTAISGSGPAYYFYFVRSMIDAGMKMGFSESEASLLVRQTMLGAIHLINSKDKSLDELITTVASKGGTTEAALNVFNEKELHKLIVDGLMAAEKRGKELSVAQNL